MYQYIRYMVVFVFVWCLKFTALEQLIGELRTCGKCAGDAVRVHWWMVNYLISVFYMPYVYEISGGNSHDNDTIMEYFEINKLTCDDGLILNTYLTICIYIFVIWCTIWCECMCSIHYQTKWKWVSIRWAILVLLQIIRAYIYKC